MLFKVYKNLKQLGIASLYGVHSVMWYFLVALPAILTTNIIFLFHGMYIFYKTNWNNNLINILMIVPFYILTYSLIPHKELRFLMPIFPILIVFCGISITKIYNNTKHQGKLITFLYSSFILNIMAFCVLSNFHQRGVIGIIENLKYEIDQNVMLNRNVDIHFLMPYYLFDILDAILHHFIHRSKEM